MSSVEVFCTGPKKGTISSVVCFSGLNNNDQKKWENEGYFNQNPVTFLKCNANHRPALKSK